MLKTLGYLLLCIGVVSLAGCQRHPDARYLVRHPQAFRSILMRCVDQKEQEEQRGVPPTSACMFAVTVYHKTLAFQKQISQNPAHFGQQILQKQIALANLNEKLHALDQSADSLRSTTKHSPREQLLKGRAGLQQDLQIIHHILINIYFSKVLTK